MNDAAGEFARRVRRLVNQGRSIQQAAVWAAEELGLTQDKMFELLFDPQLWGEVS